MMSFIQQFYQDCLVKFALMRISPQGYNNKIRAVTIFLQYLQVKDDINHFTIPVFFYKKKSYPKNCEVKNLDKKLDLLTLYLSEFPDQLRIMSLILLYTGIDKGKMFLLKNVDFYCENEDSWMKVPGTNRSIPIPDILHLLVLRYSEKNHIDIERLLFLNRDKKYTARSFEEAITKQCLKFGILDGEYVFKGNGYQKELCKTLYQNGTSIQAIREYMGYFTDETVKKYIGWVETISVSELSRNTGLSKGFFYKNEQVRSLLNEEKEKQDQGTLAQLKREVRDKSLEKQVELYQREIKRLLDENEKLKKENQKLVRALNKLQKDVK